jgi:hypothetical protein
MIRVPFRVFSGGNFPTGSQITLKVAIMANNSKKKDLTGSDFPLKIHYICWKQN